MFVCIFPATYTDCVSWQDSVGRNQMSKEEKGSSDSTSAAPAAPAPAAKVALAAAPAAPLMVTCSWIPYLPSHLSSVLI